jgi:hypothetical protein
MEAAGLPDARVHLKRQWRQLKRGSGIGASSWNGQYEYLEHPAYEQISTSISGLHAIAGDPMSSRDADDLEKLESFLRRTAELVKRRDIIPKGEGEIKKVMADYFEVFFLDDYEKNPQIGGTIKIFKPDGGVRKLRAAFEYKFADTKAEVSTSLGGIYEDVGGYTGSSDWTRFYSVVYQTKAFFSQEHFDREFARAKITMWTPILVTGEGGRTNKKSPSRRSRKKT